MPVTLSDYRQVQVLFYVLVIYVIINIYITSVNSKDCKTTLSAYLSEHFSLNMPLKRIFFSCAFIHLCVIAVFNRSV